MKCVNCPKEFDPKRKDAKYCSDKCRKEAFLKSSITRTDNTNGTDIRSNGTDNGTDKTISVVFSEPAGTLSNFEFTITIGPHDEERGLVERKSKLRTARYWYEVPLAAVPVRKKGWPEMPDWMNGRQYFLWWKNNFLTQGDPDDAGYGGPVIMNPYKSKDFRYENAGEESRKWGAR